MEPAFKRKRPAKEKILVAAEKLFQEVGYAKTTTKMIAEVSGVNEITIFRNFDTKAGILKSLALSKIELIEPFKEVLFSASHHSIEKDLTAVGIIYYQAFRANIGLILSLLNENNDDFKTSFIQIPSTAISMLQTYFEQMEASKMIVINPKMNAHFLATTFLCNLLGYLIMHHAFGRIILQEDVHELLALNVEKFMHGCIEEVSERPTGEKDA